MPATHVLPTWELPHCSQVGLAPEETAVWFQEDCAAWDGSPNSPGSVWGRLAARKPARGERAGVSDGSGQDIQPFSRLSPSATSLTPPALH